MTPTLVQILAKELRELLTGARLSHISQSDPETVDLSFFHPDRAAVHVTAALVPLKPLLFVPAKKRAALAKPPNLCRSLRKHLEYAQVTALEAEPGERILTFLFKTPGGEHRLIFEGLPKYPNLILVGPDGAIVSALRYRNDVERPVMPGEPYRQPPSPAEKPNLWSLEPTGFRSLWEKEGRPPLAGWLKDRFRGVDTELAGHLDHFGENAFSQWATVRREVLEKGWKRFTLFLGPPPTLKVFPLRKEEGQDALSFTQAAEALGRLYELESGHRTLTTERSKLESEITRALKHEKRILEKLKKDRSEAERSDQYQWWGELLMASLHKVRPHETQVRLPDVVRGGPDDVLVPLDKDATPLVNAQRYFKKAQKGSRGLALVEERQKGIQARMEELKAAQRSLPALQGTEELRKARKVLFPPKPAAVAAKKVKEEKVPTPNILREKVAKGFELCAGNSAAANEYVTFQLAQPEDLWFHVRDLPGSHVVLRRLSRDARPTDELILQAAKVAAAKSKAKPGEKVTVSYTEKKNVRRIPGAPVGMVTLTKEKSLIVEA